MIFFNFLGLGWLIAGIGLAIGLQNGGVLVQASGQYFGTVACIAIIVLDVAYRALVAKPRLAKAGVPANEVRTHWLVGPGVAGSLMFLPAWACAVIALALGLFLG